MTSLKNLDTFGLTHVGKVRENNEDQFLIASLTKGVDLKQTSLEAVDRFEYLRSNDAYIFVVADGVGGVAGGERASGAAVETVAHYVSHTMGCYYNFDVEHEQEFLDQLEKAVHRCNEEVKSYGGGRGGPASTLTMVTLTWPRAYVVHIGDSRCYFLRQGRLRPLTRDQTMGEELIDAGVMSAEQVSDRGLDHLLTSAVGADINPVIGLIDLEWGDVLLMCTDGLTKHVSDERIAALVSRKGTAREIAEALLEEALEGGGTDNVTVIVGRMIE